MEDCFSLSETEAVIEVYSSVATETEILLFNGSMSILIDSLVLLGIPKKSSVLSKILVLQDKL